jgi:cysteine synthase
MLAHRSRYCAAAGTRCHVLVPATASYPKIAQIAACGAEVIAIKGTRQDVADAALAMSRVNANHPCDLLPQGNEFGCAVSKHARPINGLGHKLTRLMSSQLIAKMSGAGAHRSRNVRAICSCNGFSRY